MVFSAAVGTGSWIRSSFSGSMPGTERRGRLSAQLPCLVPKGPFELSFLNLGCPPSTFRIAAATRYCPWYDSPQGFL